MTATARMTAARSVDDMDFMMTPSMVSCLLPDGSEVAKTRDGFEYLKTSLRVQALKISQTACD
jgi:hypothetical protein